jgi:hypothetical protein
MRGKKKGTPVRACVPRLGQSGQAVRRRLPTRFATERGAASAAPPRRRQIRGALRPRTKKISANTKLTTNKIQAMFAEIPAMPEKPSTPATSATIKNINA